MKGLRYLRDNHKVIHRGKTRCISVTSELNDGGSCSVSEAEVSAEDFFEDRCRHYRNSRMMRGIL